MILAELGIDIGPALAGLGIAGIAVGFGAQSLVKDYFNGALILLENQFAIGDVVSVAGTTGTVEDFSLRRTTVRDLDGVLHTVPNSEIKVASNRTRIWASVNLDVTVANGTDVDARDPGRERGRGGDGQRTSRGRTTCSRRRGSSASRRSASTASRSRCWARCGHPRCRRVTGELRRRLLGAFAANGIELPRPRSVVLAPNAVGGPVRPGGRRAPEPGAGRPAGEHRIAAPGRRTGPSPDARPPERARSDA